MIIIKKHEFVIIMMLLTVPILFSCNNKMENTDDIPGDKNAFDPIIAIPEVSAFAGDEVALWKIEAWRIKPDGTIDVEAKYGSSITYGFMKKFRLEREENTDTDIPLGVVVPPPNDTTERLEFLTIRILKPYSYDVERVDFEGKIIYDNYYNGGMEKKRSSFYLFAEKKEFYQLSLAAKPPISFKTIWQKAIDLGAPSDNAVANITYHSEDGYTFEISQTDYKYKFDISGKQIE